MRKSALTLIAIIALCLTALGFVGCDVELSTKEAHVHQMSYTQGVPATCLKDGSIDSWYCEKCNKYFSDANGENEIRPEKIFVEALGHDYQESITTATCLEGGYTTYTCSRCNNSYVDDKVAPLGHDLIQYEGKEATCLEGGYKPYEVCTRCDYTTYEEVAPLGHDLTQYEGKEATCTELGYKPYETCSRCDYTTYELINKLGHSYVEGEVVAPTCEELGYTNYVCENCNAEIRDNYVASLGHKWGQATYVWAEDYSTCTGTCTCLRDETHVLQEVAVTKFVIGADATETSFGEGKFYAEFENNLFNEVTSTMFEVSTDGTIYEPETTYVWGELPTEYTGEVAITCTVTKVCPTDPSKTITITGTIVFEPFVVASCTEAGCGKYVATFENPAFETQYSDLIVIPALGHNYEVVVTEATCEEQGFTTHTCANCGDSYTDNYVSALGHNFVDGVCTVCGKDIVADCEHSNLTPYEFDFTKYSTCNNQIGLYKCIDCGKIIIQDPMQIKSDCDYENATDREISEEPGKAYTSFTCPKCGLHWEASLIAYEVEPCLYYGYMSLIISKDGEVILNATYELYQEDHAGQTMAKLNLDQFGACEGTYIEYFKCAKCGKPTGFINLAGSCQLNFIEETSYTDKNNVKHIVQKYSCPVCGLTLSIDMWDECYSQCEYVDYINYTVQMDGNVLFNLNEQNYFSNHNYELTDITFKNGIDCEDGVYVTYTCTNCGQVREYGGLHNYVQLETTHLEHYGFCCGEAVVEQCEYCKKTNKFVNETCDWCLISQVGNRSTYVCGNCGNTKIVTIQWTATDGCVTTTACDIQYVANGETIYQYQQTEDFENHNIEQTITLENGLNCEGGVSITEYCTICGKVFNVYEDWGHILDGKFFELSDYGLCGGQVFQDYCLRCGYVMNLNVMDYYCIWEPYFDEYGNQVTDENGYPYMVCKVCNTIRLEGYFEDFENCIFTRGRRWIYMRNDNIILSFDYVEEQCIQHDFTPTYTLIGDTCEDGFIVKLVCNNCGYTDTYTEYGTHPYGYTDLDLETIGITCGGNGRLKVCTICGISQIDYLNPYNCNFVFVSEDNGTQIYQCNKCGLTKSVTKQYDYQGNCSYIVNTSTTYSTEDAGSLYTQSWSEWLSEQHQWVVEVEGFTGNCDDGYVLSKYCSVCGYIYYDKGQYFGHTYEDVNVDLSDYGLCGGWIYDNTCIVCGLSLGGKTDLHYCYWKHIETTENVSTYYCENCDTYFYITLVDINKDEYCWVNKETVKYEFVKNGKIVYSHTATDYSSYESHNFVTTYTLNNEDLGCNGGWTFTETCADCGYVMNEYQGYYHIYDQNFVCTICGYAHTHSYSNVYYYVNGVNCENGWVYASVCGECGDQIIIEQGNGHTYNQDDVCVRCGKEKSAGNVTSEEWNNAFNSATSYTVAYLFNFNGELLTEIGLCDFINERFTIEVEAYPLCMIFSKEGTNYYAYSFDYSNGMWTKCDYSKENYEDSVKVMMIAPEFIGKYNEFTYDAETQTYACDSIEMMNSTLSDIKVKFDNGKLVSVSMYMEHGDVTFQITDFNTTFVELPTEFIDNTTTPSTPSENPSTNEEWINAFNSVNSCTAEAQILVGEECYKQVNYFDLLNGKIKITVASPDFALYITKEGNDYFMYEYNEDNNAWVKTPTSADSFEGNGVYGLMQFLASQYSGFTYNSETGLYTCNLLKVDDTVYYTDIVVQLDGGKLVMLSYQANDGSFNTYNLFTDFNATFVELPTEFVVSNQ